MTIDLVHGDCVEWLRRYEGEPFDSCVTDPPYELGFMGKARDSSGVAFRPETWKAVFDVLRPGAHLVAFSGTRTYHRMACAIEDAGFEIRDQLAWCYGSGFPKSHDISKAIDKGAGIERQVVGQRHDAARRTSGGKHKGWKRPWMDDPEAVKRHQSVTAPATPEAAQWQGWGTALKPAWEPICLARKPIDGTVAANVLAHGTGAINVDGCRVEGGQRPHIERRNDKSLDGDVYGSGINGSRNLGTFSEGRWPANIVHDGSDEVLAGFPETHSAGSARAGAADARQQNWSGNVGNAPANRSTGDMHRFGDAGGSAARFFYSAKAGPLDRMGSKHATVKPVDLMRWLARLVTPPGGHVLEPFAGSGKTGIAAMIEGFDCTMIELEQAHVADIERQLAYLRGEGKSRVEEHLHGREKKGPDDLPLFGNPG